MKKQLWSTLSSKHFPELQRFSVRHWWQQRDSFRHESDSEINGLSPLRRLSETGRHQINLIRKSNFKQFIMKKTCTIYLLIHEHPHHAGPSSIDVHASPKAIWGLRDDRSKVQQAFQVGQYVLEQSTACHRAVFTPDLSQNGVGHERISQYNATQIRTPFMNIAHLDVEAGSRRPISHFIPQFGTVLDRILFD